jgi:hypothetical protein
VLNGGVFILLQGSYIAMDEVAMNQKSLIPLTLTSGVYISSDIVSHISVVSVDFWLFCILEITDTTCSEY